MLTARRAIATFVYVAFVSHSGHAQEGVRVGDDPSAVPEGGQAASATSRRSAGAPAVADDWRLALSGSVWGDVRLRRTRFERDADGRAGLLLRLELGERLELYVKGDVYSELADDVERSRRAQERRFRTIWDTWESSAQGRLQEAYLKIADPGLPGELRLGRQLHWGPRIVQFDGASARLELADAVAFRAYGGIPVYFYKSPWRGDLLGGAGLDLRPTPSSLIAVDYLHVTENIANVGSRRFVHDHLVTLTGRQSLGKWLRVRAQGEVLNGELDSVEGGATLTLFDLGPLDLRAAGRGRVRLDRRGQVDFLDPNGRERLSNELDPFSAQLGAENPYWFVEGRVATRWGEVVELELYLTNRVVTRVRDQDLWNRDYLRYGIAASLFDVPAAGLALTVRGELWEVTETVEGRKNGRGNDTHQVSGELAYRYSEHLRFSLGTTYQVYEHDPAARQLREDVRIYFAELRLRGRGHSLRVQYAYEHDDVDDFQSLRLGYRYDF